MHIAYASYLDFHRKCATITGASLKRAKMENKNEWSMAHAKELYVFFSIEKQMNE